MKTFVWTVILDELFAVIDPLTKYSINNSSKLSQGIPHYLRSVWNSFSYSIYSCFKLFSLN